MKSLNAIHAGSNPKNGGFALPFFRTFLTGILLMCVCSMSAQTYTGQVTDEKKQPLVSASVTLTDETSATLTYTFTDEKGNFTLSYQGEKKAARLAIQIMGYEKQLIPVAGFQNGEKVIMKQKSFKLKEVKVSAGRIAQEGDTLTYSIAGFRQKQDRKLNDVIAKMPGLEVEAGGTIKYQGKAINRFYIEGMDLMGSKYAQAGNNLSADKIESVQVLQNHQPIQTLRNKRFSDQAALNIVLKEDARNAWSGSADIGLGTTLQDGKELTYDNRLMAMVFNRRLQSLSLYKNNHTGDDIGAEVQDLASLLRESQQENGLLGQLSTSAPDLDSQRSTFNESHMAATNWLWRTPHKNDLRIQLDYLWDRTASVERNETSYTDLGGLLLTEQNDASVLTNRWKGNMEYKVNEENIYLCNNLSGSIDFNRSFGNALLTNLSSETSTATPQMVKPRKRYLTEDFSMIKTTTSGRQYNFSSQTTYNYLPGQLLILDGCLQHLNMQSLANHTYTAFGHSTGHFNLTYKAGFKMRGQQLEVSFTPSSLIERETYAEYSLYVEPAFQFKHKSIRLDGRLNTSYRHRKSLMESNNRLILEPRIFLKVEATSTTDLNLLYSYSRQDAALAGIFSTPLFTNYHTRLAHQGLLDYTGRHTARIGMEYKNSIRGNFMNLNATWGRNQHIRLYQSEYKDNLFYRTDTPNTYDANSYSLHGYAAHAFGWGKTTLSVTADYSWNDYALMLDGVQTPYQLEAGEVKLSCSTRPVQPLSIEWISSYFTHKQKNKSDASGSPDRLNSFRHTLNAYFFFGEQWQLNINNALYHSDDESVEFNHFLDAGLSYKEKRYEVVLSCNNLLGRSLYERRTVLADRMQYTVHRLRPREVMLKVSFDL